MSAISYQETIHYSFPYSFKWKDAKRVVMSTESDFILVEN